MIRQDAVTAEDYHADAMDSDDELRFDVRLGGMAERMLDRLQSEYPDGARVLDLACGNGSFARVLARQAAARGLRLDLTIVDYSRGLVEDAERTIRAELPEGFSLTAVDRDAQEYLRERAGGERFGGVFCGEYLEHVEEPHELSAA